MAQTPLDGWHRFVEQKDPAGLEELLADDVVIYALDFFSPKEGKAATVRYLTGVRHVLGNETFQYTKEIVGQGQAALEFEVEIGDRSINGVDIISWNGQGQITEFKLMIRSFKAVQLVRAMMAEFLARAWARDRWGRLKSLPRALFSGEKE